MSTNLLAQSNDVIVNNSVTANGNANVTSTSTVNNYSGATVNGNVNDYTGANFNGNGYNFGTTGDIYGNNFGTQTFNFDNGSSFFKWDTATQPVVDLQNYRSARGDVVDLSSKAISGVNRDATGIHLAATDNTSLNIGTTDSVDENLKVDLGTGNTVDVKIGQDNTDNAFTYDRETDLYEGGKNGMNVIVAQDSNFAFDMGATDNVQSFDASQTTNALVVGKTSEDNILIGGSNSSLWGGNWSNDVIQAAAGDTTIFFGTQSGVDVVYGADYGDSVNLMDVTLADIAFAGQFAENFVVGLNNGNALVLQGNTDRKFVVQGQEISYSAATSSFVSAQV